MSNTYSHSVEEKFAINNARSRRVIAKQRSKERKVPRVRKFRGG